LKCKREAGSKASAASVNDPNRYRQVRVPKKSFHGRHDIALKRIRCQIDRIEARGTAMNTIVATALKSTAEESQADVRPFTVVALFCGVGLVATLCIAALGLDVSGTIF
jgi:hypothetical protein